MFEVLSSHNGSLNFEIASYLKGILVSYFEKFVFYALLGK